MSTERKHNVRPVLGAPVYERNPLSGHEWIADYTGTADRFTTDCAFGQVFKSEAAAEDHALFLDKHCYCVTQTIEA